MAGEFIRIKNIKKTATDADFTSGMFTAIDSEGASKKLPLNLVAKQSTVGDGFIGKSITQKINEVDSSKVSITDFNELQNQVGSLSDVSAYITKGEATVAQLNAGPSGIQPGWSYRLTTAGTLTLGSLVVKVGDTVAWDGTQWFMLVNTELWASKTYVEHVEHSIASEFDETKNYVVGESCTYEGELYECITSHNGPWVATHFSQTSVEELFIKASYSKNLFDKNTPNKKASCVVYYADGTVSFNPNTFSAVVVPIPDGVTKISVNSPDAQVAAFNRVVDVTNVSSGDVISGYLGGSTQQTNVGFTLPANTKCVVVSCYTESFIYLQVESGSTVTEYEPYVRGINWNAVIQSNAIDNKVNNKLNAEYGKNLFDKNTSNKKTPCVVYYANGYLSFSPDTFSAVVVPIPRGVTQISVNSLDAQISAYNHMVDITAINEVTTIPGYLGGTTQQSNVGFNLPVGTKCVIVSTLTSQLQGLQVESGNAITGYEPYVRGIHWDKVIGVPQIDLGILHVGAGYTYTTLQSAIDAASNGDTIIVHEGIYTESVNVYSSNKFLTIKGTSKKDCILTYSNENYNAPPIMIGKGCVENLSIIATGTTQDPDAPDYAYCAHIDYDNEENSSLTFNNCYFENEWWACVGIGLRKNFTVSFILCDFVSRGAGRAVFCHGAWGSNNNNQILNLIDCSIYTIQEGRHGASIYLEEITGYSGNEMTICMQRCIVKNANGYEPTGKAVYIGKHGTGTGGEGSGGPGYLGSQQWYLHPMSEMNSCSICNYSEQ